MRKLRLLTIALLTLALSTGVAAAAGGALTAFEYQQLVTTRDKLKTAKGVSAAIWDCEQIQMQTQLLTEERTDCASQFQLDKFNSTMRSYEKDCSPYRSAVDRLKCLLPPYEQFYRTDAAYYRAELRIHQIATSRGLGEACADLLSDKPLVISEEKAALDAIGRIITAIKAGSVLDFEAESGKAMTALAEVATGQQGNNGPTSICPHD